MRSAIYISEPCYSRISFDDSDPVLGIARHHIPRNSAAPLTVEKWLLLFQVPVNKNGNGWSYFPPLYTIYSLACSTVLCVSSGPSLPGFSCPKMDFNGRVRDKRRNPIIYWPWTSTPACDIGASIDSQVYLVPRDFMPLDHVTDLSGIHLHGTHSNIPFRLLSSMISDPDPSTSTSSVFFRTHSLFFLARGGVGLYRTRL